MVDLVIIFIVLKKHKLAEEVAGVSDGRNDLSKGIEKGIRAPGRSQYTIKSCYKLVKRRLETENM